MTSPALPAPPDLHAPTVLIVCGSPLAGALLGALVELHGYAPAFPSGDELTEEAVARVRPIALILDCDDTAACRDSVYDAAAARGASVVLFSPSRLSYEVAEQAAQRGLEFFTFPITPAGLLRHLQAAPPRPPARDEVAPRQTL